MSDDRKGLPVNPGALARPRGYSNGLLAPAGGRLLFIAGQIGWDREARIVSAEFERQFEQALANVVTVVREAGGEPHHICQLTIYVVDKKEYLDDLQSLGRVYRSLMGDHDPTMALVEVAALVDDGARLEIQGNAVLPAATEEAAR